MCRLIHFPTRDQGYSLHLRLRAHDATASADVCAAFAGPLYEWLAAGHPRVDDHLCSTAVNDAIVGYLNKPDIFDPQRLDLAAYLRMAARADLRNLLCKEHRRRRHEMFLADVELGPDGGNISGREDEPSTQMERDEDAAEWPAFLQRVRDELPAADRLAFDLLIAGERSTAAYAVALGLAALPPAEQEGEVKRVKDRIKKRIQREGNHRD